MISSKKFFFSGYKILLAVLLIVVVGIVLLSPELTGLAVKSAKTTKPANIPPTASFTATPESGTAPLKIDFDASGSSDTDGKITKYKWAFGSGASKTTAAKTISYTYTKAGTYNVKLTVTDNKGATASATKQITASAAQQTKQATAPSTKQATIPSLISSSQPKGIITKTNTVLQVVTTKAAACRFSESPNIDYNSMKYAMVQSSNKKTHIYPFPYLQPGKYVYYVKCKNIATNIINAQDYEIAFQISASVW